MIEPIIESTQYGRYGYRRITAMLRQEGWQVNHKWVKRIWKSEELEVPKKQPKRSRLRLTDGSGIRLRPRFRDHLWSYDFVIDRTADGRAFRILNTIDEYTRECLAILAKRRITSQDIIDQLFQLIIFSGIPEHIGSDNGPEFTAKAVSRLVKPFKCEDAVHRTGKPMGERVHRVIQWKAAR